MSKNPRLARCVGLTVALLAGLSGVASAAPAQHRNRDAPVTVSAVRHPSLTGYQQVAVAYAAGWDTQASGTATCPSGTQLVGGGVSLEDTPALTQAITSSSPAPAGRTWRGTVDNPIMAGSDFIVRADCVTTVPGYAIVAGTAVSNPAGKQTVATVSCPAGTVALGGGGHLSSMSTSVSLNDDYPLAQGKGWHVDANNASGGADTVKAFAICGDKPTNYALVKGPATAVGAAASGRATAICAPGSTALGGGGSSTSRSITVDLSGTTASGTNAWEADASDTASPSSKLSAYAIYTKITT